MSTFVTPEEIALLNSPRNATQATVTLTHLDLLALEQQREQAKPKAVEAEELLRALEQHPALLWNVAQGASQRAQELHLLGPWCSGGSEGWFVRKTIHGEIKASVRPPLKSAGESGRWVVTVDDQQWATDYEIQPALDDTDLKLVERGYQLCPTTKTTEPEP